MKYSCSRAFFKFNRAKSTIIIFFRIRAVRYGRLLCQVGDYMISKYCDRCHKKLKVGERCGCTEKLKADEKRDYTNHHSDSFYSSTEWQKAREQCKILCCGLDLYSLYVKGVIEYGFTVHHIVPIDVDRKLRLTQSNLIYLTESNHRLIHSLYKTGRYSETVELLKNLKKKHIQGVD